MAYILADNIISPLGDTSEANYLSVKDGKSGIHAYECGSHGIPEGFTASLMSHDFEDLALRSARCAVNASKVDVTKERVVFILSTTKGPIERLTPQHDESIYLGQVARRIAQQLGISSQPYVVCNACISGLSALILAERLLAMDRYSYAVVCGCDTPDRFIISGFQSLKALSSEPCRPFDMERFGLNLGEAAATMVLANNIPSTSTIAEDKMWQISHGVVRNDAFHISAPSKTAEGLYEALELTLNNVDHDDLAFVNAHGTATLFNDQMESVAIKRAGLSDVPLNALKGYFGHTLGAAGVLETILSMKAADDHVVLGTRGFEELGVSGKVNISPSNRHSDKYTFVKMLSGFGGCNATILAQKTEETQPSTTSATTATQPICKKVMAPHTVQSVRMTPDGVWVNGKPLPVSPTQDGTAMLTAVYKQQIGDYPKFYKMDGLCRLGFVASELLLKAEGKTRFEECSNRAVVLFNRTSSVSSDLKYLASIQDKDDYYPSPSVFVYTLPNIVTGEIAIRNHYHGETSFFILSEKNEEQMAEVQTSCFMDSGTESMLTGWIDYTDDTHYEAELYLIEKENENN